MHPHRLFLQAEKTGTVTLQNCLLTTSDVDLAIIFSDVPEQQLLSMLDHGGEKKKARVLEELQRIKRVKVYPEDLKAIQDWFIGRLQGKKSEGFRRYFKPKDRTDLG